MCTEADMVAGLEVICERKDNIEEGTVVKPSKKGNGMWVVKFASDGKLLPREPNQMMPIPDEVDEEDDVLEEADMEKGLKVIAERKGEMAVGTVLFKSKKGEGKWVVQFEDSKKVPCSIETMRRA